MSMVGKGVTSSMGLRHPGLLERAQLKDLREAAEPERRPKKRGQLSEARRLRVGFAMLAGEGVRPDEAYRNDEDNDDCC